MERGGSPAEVAGDGQQEAEDVMTDAEEVPEPGGEQDEPQATAVAAAGQPRLAPPDIPFEWLVRFLDMVAQRQGRGSIARKRSLIERFLGAYVDRDGGQAWELLRLLLPHLDRHRPHFMLKYQKLGAALVEACGLQPDSAAAATLRAWQAPNRRGSGDFARVLQENLLCMVCLERSDPALRLLTVGAVNAALDDLAAAAGDQQRAAVVLRWLLQRMSAPMARVLIQIILKDQRLLPGEQHVFQAWHRDAQARRLGRGKAVFDTCMDARRVFNECWDPQVRYDGHMALGRPAAPQLAAPQHSVAGILQAIADSRKALSVKGTAAALAAFVHETCAAAGPGAAAFTSDSLLLEPKLDGERQQVHVMGPGEKCQYWSRRGINQGPPADVEAHSAGYEAFDEVVRAQVGDRRCILDGELIAWHKRRQRFEVFGSVRPSFKAALERRPPRERIPCSDFDSMINVADLDWEEPEAREIEILYVAWDLLWLEGQDLSDLPLMLRRARLRQLVNEAPPEGYRVGPEGSAIRGRVVVMEVGAPLRGGAASWLGGAAAARPSSHYHLVPRLVSSAEEVEEAMRQALERQEEGVVVKCPLSPWRAADRSGSWAKYKPDYVYRMDMDALIIGVSFSDQRNKGHKGWFGEFLLGIRQRRPPAAGPDWEQRWVSFAKVGSGLNDGQLEALHDRLKDNLCEQEHPPPCYEYVASSSQARPKYWVADPLRSAVLEVQADLRPTRSSHFASRYSLRFPRVARVRSDRGALDCMSEEELDARVQQVHDAGASEELERRSRKPRVRAGKPKTKRGRQLPAKLADLDTSKIKPESDALAGCALCVLNYGGGGPTKERCQRLIALMSGELWGSFVKKRAEAGHMIVLAGQPAGRAWDAAQGCCDVLILSWLERCWDEGRRVEPHSAEYLRLTPASLARLQAEQGCDQYGVPLAQRVCEADLAVFLRRMPSAAQLLAAGELNAWQQPLELPPGSSGGEEEEDAAVLMEAQQLQLRHTLRRCAGADQVPSVRLAARMDAEFAEIGWLEADALLHGCRVVVVGAPPPGRAPSSARLFPGVADLQEAGDRRSASLLQSTLRHLRNLAGLPGASVSSCVDAHTTHLVVLVGGSAGAASSCDPAALLAAVSGQCGGGEALAALHQRLQAGRLAVVRGSWLEACAERVAEFDGAAQPPAPERSHALELPGWQSWPWPDFPPGAQQEQPAVAAAAVGQPGSVPRQPAAANGRRQRPRQPVQPKAAPASGTASSVASRPGATALLEELSQREAAELAAAPDSQLPASQLGSQGVAAPSWGAGGSRRGGRAVKRAATFPAARAADALPACASGTAARARVAAPAAAAAVQVREPKRVCSAPQASAAASAAAAVAATAPAVPAVAAAAAAPPAVAGSGLSGGSAQPVQTTSLFDRMFGSMAHGAASSSATAALAPLTQSFLAPAALAAASTAGSGTAASQGGISKLLQSMLGSQVCQGADTAAAAMPPPPRQQQQPPQQQQQQAAPPPPPPSQPPPPQQQQPQQAPLRQKLEALRRAARERQYAADFGDPNQDD